MSPEPIGIGDLSSELERLAHIAMTASTDDTEFVQQFADALKRDFATRAGYSAQFDSNPVADDPFDVMSHEDIWAKAGSLDPSTIDQTANNWRALGFEAARSAASFAQQIAGQIGTNWQGVAADAAGQGVQKYANSSVELMLSADTLATKVMESFGGVTSTKAMLPPPVPYAGGEKILDALTWSTRTFLPGDMKSFQHLHEEAEEAARSVMKTQYAPVIREAAVQVPVLPPAVNPLNGSDAPNTFPGLGDPRMDSNPIPYSGFGSGGSGSGGSGQEVSGQGGSGQAGPGQGGSGQGANDSQAQPQAAATPQDTATQASSWAPSESPGAGQQSGTGTSGPGGQGTSGPGGQGTSGPGGQGTSSSSTSGSPHGGSMATGQGGSSGRSPSGGAGGRFGGSGSLGGAGGGSSLGGAQGGGLGSSAGGAAPGGAAGAGRIGAPGMGGMGGMAPAGGRGGPGGDDDVHTTPGYLIDAVNGDDLIGSLPLVAPPVLGE